MQYTATITWNRRPDEVMTDNKYSRVHHWSFDGGQKLQASASPQVVPLPMSDASLIDPEEAFVASISSCHMLFFLSFAATKKYLVESYVDEAKGIMAKNTEGKTVMQEIILHPQITFGQADQPSPEIIAQLHHQAHESCFLANSIKTKITIS